MGARKAGPMKARRLVRSASALALVLLGSSASIGKVAPTNFEVGALAPTFLRAGSPDGLVLAWVFPVNVLLSCDSPSGAFRRLQRSYPDRVKLVVVAVGRDPDILEPFLRRERLHPVVIRLSEVEYAQHFGATPHPSVQIVRGDRLREMVSDTTWADGVKLDQRGIKETAEALME